MILGYHGTSLDAAQKILKEGYKSKPTKLWKVSTGKCHVFSSNSFDNAVFQSLNATIISHSQKRAVLAIDITNKNKRLDKHCGQEDAYEILEEVNKKDIVAIYSDIKPLHPLIKVFQKIAICKMQNLILFKNECIELNEEEQEIYNMIQSIKLETSYKTFLKLIYKRKNIDLDFEKYETCL